MIREEEETHHQVQRSNVLFLSVFSRSLSVSVTQTSNSERHALTAFIKSHQETNYFNYY